MIRMREISSFEDLDDVMTNLHDCPFDLPRERFDASAQTWTGLFLRPVWEDPLAQHTGWRLYGSTRLPVVESKLTLIGVTGETVTDEEGIDTYGFTEIKRLSNGVRFRYAEHLSIDVELAGPVAGTYEEKPLPNLVAIYRQRLLLQSGPYFEQMGGTPAA
jgi:hypothetical protein